MVTKYNSTISTSKTCFSLRRKKKYFPWRFKDLWLLSCDTSESNFRDNTSGQNRQNTFGSSNESNNKALLKLSKFNCNLTAVLTSFSIFVSTIFFFLVELPRTSRTVLNIVVLMVFPYLVPNSGEEVLSISLLSIIAVVLYTLSLLGIITKDVKINQILYLNHWDNHILLPLFC